MIEFFYDCSSPWTYLGFDSIRKLAVETGVEVVWKPILVGAVFNAINPSVYAQRQNPIPAKQRYLIKDLQDWASLQGLEIRFPPTVFPVNSAQAMRACLVAARHGLIVPFSEKVFRAYWTDDHDIASNEVLARLANDVGLAGPEVISLAGSPQFRELLRANTNELIARGGFGSPTTFVAGDDMFFGNDRTLLIRRAIESRRGAAPSVAP